jgi:hypothetical protein
MVRDILLERVASFGNKSGLRFGPPPNRGLCLALVFSGCLDLEKVITLNADGSGTLVETGILTKDEVKRRKENAEPSTPPDPDDAAFNWISENRLRERASELGEGVTFVSAKRVSTDKGQGWATTYAFLFAGIPGAKVDLNNLYRVRFAAGNP